MAHNCGPQLSCQVHHGCLLLSFCCMLALLYKETCAGKNNRFLRSSRVVQSLYEAAWDLVTKCLSNRHTRSFPICFPTLPLMFSHVSCSVSLVSLCISYICPSVSLCFLFWAWQNLDTFSWNRSNHGETLKEEPLHSGHFYSRRCYGRHSFFSTTWKVQAKFILYSRHSTFFVENKNKLLLFFQMFLFNTLLYFTFSELSDFSKPFFLKPSCYSTV